MEELTKTKNITPPWNKGKYKTHDIVGNKYGKWTVVAFSHRVFYKRKKGTKSDFNTVWDCVCDCGNKKKVIENSLVSKRSKSCGCLRGEQVENKFYTLPDDLAIKKKIFGDYKRQAKSREYSFNLSFELFKDMIQKKCYYCNSLPNNRQTTSYSSPNFKYNGIDRMDNTIGYEEWNVVPCCKKCNRAKDVMSESQFMIFIENIYNNFVTKWQQQSKLKEA